MKKFRYETNGYSRRDVNEFVTYVISEMESLIEKVQKQNEEISELNDKILKYQEQEKEISESFDRLESTGNQIRLLALEEKKIIIDEAKQYASRILNDALLHAESIEKEKSILEENARLWREQLEKIIEEQQSVLEKLIQVDVS